METVTVLGAGLAGSECAWQLAKRGIRVRLWEMKPEKMSPAHQSPYFGELVCSNSLRSDELTNAVGLLKAEMRAMDSLIMASADANKVAAGGALAEANDQVGVQGDDVGHRHERGEAGHNFRAYGCAVLLEFKNFLHKKLPLQNFLRANRIGKNKISPESA